MEERKNRVFKCTTKKCYAKNELNFNYQISGVISELFGWYFDDTQHEKAWNRKPNKRLTVNYSLYFISSDKIYEKIAP